MMPSLLDLPRELRDEIFDLVLFTPSKTPRDLSCYDYQRRDLDVLYPDPNVRHSYLVKVLPSDIQHSGFSTTSTSLLLVNRQINTETSRLLQRKRPSYILDVAIVNDRELWPTWILVPSLAREVDEVYVSIRTVTTERLGWAGKTNRWLGGDGVPPLAWAFNSMLQLFLRHGPLMNVMGHSKQQGNDRKISIQRLTLDVRSPMETSQPSANYAIGPYNSEVSLSRNISKLGRLRRESTGINYIMHQEILLNLLVGPINMVLYHPKRHSRLLYERMGTIQIMLDGAVRDEWDLLEWFAKLEAESLKELMYRERQKMGLPVPENLMK